MKYCTIPLLLLLLLPACKSKTTDNSSHIPPAVISKMLTDIHIAEAYSTMVKDSLRKGNSKDMDSLAYYYKSIFAHYHVTSEQFDNSLEWYRQHPDEFDTAYASVIPAIAKLQDKKASNIVPVLNHPAPDTTITNRFNRALIMSKARKHRHLKGVRHN